MPEPLPAAVLDACVLYPAPLRDLLMRLAASLYQPKWTDDIHDEWVRNVLADRPDLDPARLARTRLLMDRHGGDCRVTRYRHLIPALSLPDPEDRHVLAAAIAARAAVIVTFNLKDFPPQAMAPHGVAAVHPDDFAAGLYARKPAEFLGLVRQHRAALVSPAKTAEEYLATLEHCGLRAVARLLRARADEI